MLLQSNIIGVYSIHRGHSSIARLGSAEAKAVFFVRAIDYTHCKVPEEVVVVN